MTGGQVIEMANYDRWPGYRGGQLYSFHCINEQSLCAFSKITSHQNRLLLSVKHLEIRILTRCNE
jgi:hypothetical protein